MEDKIVQLAYNVLSILIPILAALAVEFLRRKLSTERIKRIQEELAAKQELALLAVKAVEQLWGGILHGEEKVQKATEIISQQAAKVGLAISPEEIRTMIEWAVRTMKDEFGENWANAIQQTQ